MMKNRLGFSDLAIIFKVTAEQNRSNLRAYGVGHLFSVKQFNTTS